MGKYQVRSYIQNVGDNRIINENIKVENGIIYLDFKFEDNIIKFKYENECWHQWCDIHWVNLQGGVPAYDIEECLDDIIFEQVGE